MNRKIFFSTVISVVLVVIGVVAFLVNQSSRRTANQATSGNIKVGDYVSFGSYYSDPILWKCVDTSNGTMLLSEYIICMKAYDAAESSQWGKEGGTYTKVVDGQEYGSKDWKTSNLREWLNSDASKVKFSTQPPVKTAVLNGENAYADEPGFLSNFTDAERSSIKSVSHDGCSDKVYLLSVDEVYKYIGGSGLEIDSARDSSTIRLLTEKARNNSEFKFNSNWKNDWWYYTRTPHIPDPKDTRVATFGGGYYYYDNHIFYGVYPGTGIGGVLPALNLKSNICKSGDGSKENPWVLK
ncbi:MAG: DUF6273 domain-containing protein [Bacillota bacterium]|nr:DUF6273 domain-containing protein [Bacillota bacterium]